MQQLGVISDFSQEISALGPAHNGGTVKKHEAKQVRAADRGGGLAS